MRHSTGILFSLVTLVVFVLLPTLATAEVASQSLTSAQKHDRDIWRKALLKTPMPSKGCFKASFPNKTWTTVSCVAAPHKPYGPAKGIRPETVGNGQDLMAHSTKSITLAEGSFDSVTGVKRENDSGNSNTYSLQLNTNFFKTTASACKKADGCTGWEQFVYSSSESKVFIQYWLLNYDKSCPSGWNSNAQSDNSANSCWINSAAVPIPSQSISDLQYMTLSAQANSDGTDTILVATADGDANGANQDSFLDLAGNWDYAEFNIFGDGDGSEASFQDIGSAVVVRTAVTDGTNQAPDCISAGFTAETNNLNVIGSCTATGGDSPAIVFKEALLGPGAARDAYVSVYHGQQHFAYRDKAGNIQDAWYDGNEHWNLQKLNLSGRTSGPSAVAGPVIGVFKDQQHFAYADKNGGIWDSWYDGSGNWNLQQINIGSDSRTEAPFMNQDSGENFLTVWVDGTNAQQHFTYLAKDQQIYDAFWDSNSGRWSSQNLNAIAYPNCPAPASRPFASVYGLQQHVGYIDRSGLVWDCWYDGNGHWSPQQLTEGSWGQHGRVVGPRAAHGLFISVYNNQQHFAYVDENGGLQDCWYDGNGNWAIQQLNKGSRTSGPAAAGNPVVSVYDNQQHFAYRDDAGNIQDVWYNGSGTWSLQKLNNHGVSTGPSAAIGPFASVFGNQQHFAYIDGEGNLWDVWYEGNGLWNQQQIAGR